MSDEASVFDDILDFETKMYHFLDPPSAADDDKFRSSTNGAVLGRRVDCGSGNDEDSSSPRGGVVSGVNGGYSTADTLAAMGLRRATPSTTATTTPAPSPDEIVGDSTVDGQPRSQWYCTICQRSFAAQFALDQHRRFKHQGYKIHCRRCSHTTTNGYAMFLHVKRDHRESEDISAANVNGAVDGAIDPLALTTSSNVVVPRSQNRKAVNARKKRRAARPGGPPAPTPNPPRAKPTAGTSLSFDAKQGILINGLPNTLPDTPYNRRKRNAQAIKVGSVPTLDCTKCDKKFAFHSGLRMHMKMVHSGFKFTCQYCGMHFTNGYAIHRHVNIVHNVLGSVRNTGASVLAMPSDSPAAISAPSFDDVPSTAHPQILEHHPHTVSSFEQPAAVSKSHATVASSFDESFHATLSKRTKLAQRQQQQKANFFDIFKPELALNGLLRLNGLKSEFFDEMPADGGISGGNRYGSVFNDNSIANFFDVNNRHVLSANVNSNHRFSASEFGTKDGPYKMNGNHGIVATSPVTSQQNKSDDKIDRLRLRLRRKAPPSKKTISSLEWSPEQPQHNLHVGVESSKEAELKMQQTDASYHMAHSSNTPQPWLVSASSSSQLLSCPLCPFHATCPDTLRRHHLRHVGGDAVPSTRSSAAMTPSPEQLAASAFRCSYCSYACDRHASLVLHAALHFVVDKSAVYNSATLHGLSTSAAALASTACTYCGRRLEGAEALARHEAKHTATG